MHLYKKVAFAEYAWLERVFPRRQETRAGFICSQQRVILKFNSYLASLIERQGDRHRHAFNVITEETLTKLPADTEGGQLTIRQAGKKFYCHMYGVCE